MEESRAGENVGDDAAGKGKAAEEAWKKAEAKDEKLSRRTNVEETTSFGDDKKMQKVDEGKKTEKEGAVEKKRRRAVVEESLAADNKKMQKTDKGERAAKRRQEDEDEEARERERVPKEAAEKWELGFKRSEDECM